MFYVYLLIDPSTNIPFYVGKGKGKRYKVHFNPSSQGQNKLKDAAIRQIIKRGDEVMVRQTLCDTEVAAYELERNLITLYGRIDLGTGSLTNLQEGGEGAGSGRILSADTRAKQSTARLGRECDQRVKDKIASTINQSGICTAVIQYTMNGEEIARYPSARSASKATGVDGSHILYCCRGVYPHAKGYVWKFQHPEAHQITKRSKQIKARVEKCDKDWNVLETFDSCSDAAKSVGTGISYMARVSKANDFAFGYYWRRA